MDTLLIASLIVDLIAFGIAIRLLYKTRDWRLSFLTATTVFFIIHQWSALKFAESLSLTVHAAFRAAEIADLAASVMILLSIFFVGRLIKDEGERTAELRISEARYRSLFDDAPVMLHTADRNGRLIDVNRHWLKVMGFARDEVIGTDMKDYLADESRQHAVEVSLRSGDASEVPYSLTNKAGERVEVLASSIAEKEEHGAFSSSRSAMVDVTDQREAETLLLESLESSPDSIAIFDSRDRLKLYNDAFEASVLSNVAGRVELNMQFEELLRSLVEENLIIIPEGNAEDYIRKRLELHRLGNSTIEVELTDGRWFVIKERRMPGGGTASTRSDITERKRANLALQESEQRLRTIIGNVPGIVYQRIQHADGSVTFPFVSTHYKGEMGFDFDNAVGNPQEFLGKLYDEDRDEWMAAWRKSAKSNTPFDREVRLLRSNKDIRWVRVRAVPQRLPNGETKWDAIGINVTDEKRATEVRDRAFAAIENLTEGVALFGPDDRLVYTNPRYVEFNKKGGSVVTPGKTFEQIVRRNVRLGRVPEAIGREKAWIAKRIAAHRNPPYVAERKIGNRWFDIREAALPDGSTVLLNIDITERRRAHAALAESEARLRLLADSLPVGINYLDTNLRYRFANKAYCTWHGIDPDEIIGKSTREVLGAKAIKVMTPSIKAALTGENVNFEARVPYKNAGERDVQIIAVPHADNSGEIIGTYGLVLDLTEQKQASEVRDRTFAALENLSEGVALFGPVDRLIFANRRFIELNEEAGAVVRPGRSFEEILRKSVSLGRIPEAVGREEKWIKERLKAHHKLPYTAERKVGKGWQEVREEALPDGSVIYLVSDITQRKKTAETIRENEQQLSLITENVPAMIGHFGRDERFRFANSSYKKALGLSPKKLVGMSLREVWGDEIYATIADNVRRVLNGETVKFENILPGKDGRPRNVAAIYVPHIVNGAVEAFFSLAIDITQQMTAQQALRARDKRLQQTQSELLRVNRAAIIGQLSSSLTHEIKQPLAAATFYMQAIQQLLRKDGQKTSNEVSVIIDKVGDQVGRAAAVVGRLRPLLERGEVESKEAEINEVVEDAVAVAGLELDRKNIELRTILGRSLPRVSIDRIQVQQVLLNLVRNGVEASRNSKRRELTVKTRKTKGGEIEVSISDTGRGIPAKLRKTMFDPFVTTHAGGSGMGLSISRTIVEAHGGRIWASLRRGGGTIMHFTLRLAAQRHKQSTLQERK